jgi:hypothetical protein
LSDRLHLTCDEFNAEVVAGISTTARLQKLLDSAGFAFLVMTAEDIHADNTAHARENVIHEVGLFQGCLGFERAIILLEDGCAQFSNIHGLTYISFPNMGAAFEQIRLVLERENVGLTASPIEGAQRPGEQFPQTHAKRAPQSEPVPSLSEAARELLLETAAQGSNGMIMSVGTAAGRRIQTNKRSFVEPGNARSEARWKGAIAELQQQGLVEDRSHKGQSFSVTDRAIGSRIVSPGNETRFLPPRLRSG